MELTLSKKELLHCLRDRIRDERRFLGYYSPENEKNDSIPTEIEEDEKVDYTFSILNCEVSIGRIQNLIDLINRDKDDQTYTMTLEDFMNINPI